jgi:microcystin-dependent protein
LANAQNGTAINMTAKSSPEWTITHTFTARTLAEAGGADTHAMTDAQLLAHTHSIAGGAGGGGNLYQIGNNTGVSTGSTGGNEAMNIKNPFLAQNFIIFAGA